MIYGYVVITRDEEVLWSKGSSTGWFPYSWDKAEVSNVSVFEQISYKRTLNGACHVAEEYAEARVFIHAGSILLSGADDQRQFEKW